MERRIKQSDLWGLINLLLANARFAAWKFDPFRIDGLDKRVTII